jgi:hypothetical protein
LLEIKSHKSNNKNKIISKKEEMKDAKKINEVDDHKFAGDGDHVTFFPLDYYSLLLSATCSRQPRVYYSHEPSLGSAGNSLQQQPNCFLVSSKLGFARDEIT